MPKKTTQTTGPGAPTSPRPKSSPPKQTKTSSLPQLKRQLPAVSVSKAKKAFENFSLSKFAGSPRPANYIAEGQALAETQRKLISQRIEKLNSPDAPTRAMTIALPDVMIKKLLPSYNAKTRTIDLGEVISLIQQNMSGTEFYASGNPTLSRLMIQSQVQQILDDVKRSAKK